MERKYDHNQPIIYVDPKGVRHTALVTAWWGVPEASWHSDVFGSPTGHDKDGKPFNDGEPGCNLLFVSSDPDRHDSCGRQMERETSVVHKSRQPAHGNFWCWPDEV